MSDRLTDLQHWEKEYEGIEFKKPSKDALLVKWINEHINNTKNASCFEVGAYPGGYLSVFGDLGYELNGIDIVPAISDLEQWLRNNDYKVGNLFCDDFFSFGTSKRFDIVYSLGFIEHFKNFEEVLRLQSKLVNKGGYLLVETPNFVGIVQKYLKYFLDKKNLDIHYTPSMNFKKWEAVLKKEGFEIVKKEFIGSFSFETYSQERNILQKFLIRTINRYRYFIRKQIFRKQSKHYSPFMILLAQKKS